MKPKWCSLCFQRIPFKNIFKTGEKYDAANYRPVSLTCICCRTLEHILVSNISRDLALGSILSDL